MNIADIIVAAAVGAAVLLAVVLLRRNKKKGRSSCGCSCPGCPGSCGRGAPSR